jgi:DUF4097 and DUF4098 domain-containing protein YvlB
MVMFIYVHQFVYLSYVLYTSFKKSSEIFLKSRNATNSFTLNLSTVRYLFVHLYEELKVAKLVLPKGN